MKLRCIVALGISLLIAVPSWASEADALASIPGEAVGFICIPNPEELDADVKTAIESLGFGAMVPLPNNSILTMAQSQLPWLKGMDVDQPLLVAIMPGDDVEEMDDTQVVMIPTEDPSSMLEQLNGTESNGNWSVNIKGKTLAADVDGNYVQLADRDEILDDVEASKGNMSAEIIAPVANAMADLDVIVGLNVDAVSGVLGSWLEDNFYPMMEAQAKTDLQKEQMKLQQKQISRFLEGLETILMGIRMEDDGIAFRMVFGAKEGSEISEAMHLAVSSDSLLEGLPGGNWAMAGGQFMDELQAKVQAKNLDEMFAAYENADGVDKAKMTELKTNIKRWLNISRGYRMSVSPSADGAEGVLSASIIAASENSQEWLDLSSKTFELAKEVLGGLDEDVSKVLSAITMSRGGEALRFAVDLSQVDQIDEDQQEMIENIVGADTAFSMKAVNDSDVLISFGEPATNGDSGNENAGIKALAGFLPAERNSVNYIFVDQSIELARKVLIAIDEDDLPFVTPEIDEPIAMTTTGGEDWSMVDFVIPMEVIEAGRDIGMTMMGRQ